MGDGSLQGREQGSSDALREALRGELRHIGEPQLAAAAGHLIGQGKLIRPRLMLAIYEGLTGWPQSMAIHFAVPIELVHTFTLIHDDLPCMDDAELRRGLPTVHKQFGEANAVLAGDALLNLAFLSLSRGSAGASPETRLKLIECLAQATHEVIEGQVLDIAAEGHRLSVEEVKRIHWLKTGALISAACAMGGILAEASSDQIKELRSFGHTLGVIFQAKDDLLLFDSSSAESGKSLNSDEEKAKATLPRVMGLEATREYLAERSERLAEKLEALNLSDGEALRLLVAQITSR